MPSAIQVEAFGRDSGIYIIFNKNTDSVYIGKSKDLKRRMEEHISFLFDGCDNNPKLQNEFSEGNHSYRMGLLEKVPIDKLDDYESIYFQAATKLYGKDCVYNEIALDKAVADNAQIMRACEKILEAKERETPVDRTFKSAEEARGSIRDWLARTTDEILDGAVVRVQELSKTNGARIGQKEPVLDSVSLRELYEKDALNFLLIGVMGEYVGDGKAQAFTEILSEKLGDIAYYGKCLWATDGPNTDEFRSFREKYGFEEGKKIYALFPLTTAEYKSKDKRNEEEQAKSGKNQVHYTWTDERGCILPDTGPGRRTHRYKGLVIDRIWTVEESFLTNSFYDLYYRYERRVNQKGETVLASNVANCVRKMQSVVSKKEVLNNEDLQRKLGLEGEAFEKFKKEIAPPEHNYADFIECNDDPENPAMYVLAEVVDYVWMDESMTEPKLQ